MFRTSVQGPSPRPHASLVTAGCEAGRVKPKSSPCHYAGVPPTAEEIAAVDALVHHLITPLWAPGWRNTERTYRLRKAAVADRKALDAPGDDDLAHAAECAATSLITWDADNLIGDPGWSARASTPRDYVRRAWKIWRDDQTKPVSGHHYLLQLKDHEGDEIGWNTMGGDDTTTPTVDAVLARSRTLPTITHGRTAEAVSASVFRIPADGSAGDYLGDVGLVDA